MSVQRPSADARVTPHLIARLATTEAEVRAAQRLRYDVFVTELQATGPMVDHENRREADHFDDFADHLLLIDDTRPADTQVVGSYRLMTRESAARAGQFYCADEYDLTPLLQSDLRLLELGRSCLHPDYRGGTGMLHLWSALAAYVEARGIDVMFGVASFHGTDVSQLAQPLAILQQKHLAPPHLRVKAKGPHAIPLAQLAAAELDRIKAVRAIPALIKAYLRLGATVGEGAFVDHDFNTVDICLILEKAAIRALQHTIYTQRAGHD